MATHLDLQEQEQVDQLKDFWKQYGNLVMSVLLAATVSMAGWQGWNWWQRSQAAQAAAVYGALERAAATHDAKKARDATGELIDKYSMSSYAGMAALLSARMQVEAGDLKTAKLQLGWAQENARDRGLRDLARLRLAAVLLDEKAYDEALKQLASEPAASFATRYAELRGDILAAQGKVGEAKNAYQAALAKVDEAQKVASPDQRRSQYRELLQLKFESMGGQKP